MLSQLTDLLGFVRAAKDQAEVGENTDEMLGFDEVFRSLTQDTEAKAPAEADHVTELKSSLWSGGMTTEIEEAPAEDLEAEGFVQGAADSPRRTAPTFEKAEPAEEVLTGRETPSFLWAPEVGPKVWSNDESRSETFEPAVENPVDEKPLKASVVTQTVARMPDGETARWRSLQSLTTFRDRATPKVDVPPIPLPLDQIAMTQGIDSKGKGGEKADVPSVSGIEKTAEPDAPQLAKYQPDPVAVSRQHKMQQNFGKNRNSDLIFTRPASHLRDVAADPRVVYRGLQPKPDFDAHNLRANPSQPSLPERNSQPPMPDMPRAEIKQASRTVMADSTSLSQSPSDEIVSLQGQEIGSEAARPRAETDAVRAPSMQAKDPVRISIPFEKQNSGSRRILVEKGATKRSQELPAHSTASNAATAPDPAALRRPNVSPRAITLTTPMVPVAGTQVQEPAGREMPPNTGARSGAAPRSASQPAQDTALPSFPPQLRSEATTEDTGRMRQPDPLVGRRMVPVSEAMPVLDGTVVRVRNTAAVQSAQTDLVRSETVQRVELSSREVRQPEKMPDQPKRVADETALYGETGTQKIAPRTPSAPQTQALRSSPEVPLRSRMRADPAVAPLRKDETRPGPTQLQRAETSGPGPQPTEEPTARVSVSGETKGGTLAPASPQQAVVRTLGEAVTVTRTDFPQHTATENPEIQTGKPVSILAVKADGFEVRRTPEPSQKPLPAKLQPEFARSAAGGRDLSFQPFSIPRDAGEKSKTLKGDGSTAQSARETVLPGTRQTAVFTTKRPATVRSDNVSTKPMISVAQSEPNPSHPDPTPRTRPSPLPLGPALEARPTRQNPGTSVLSPSLDDGDPVGEEELFGVSPGEARSTAPARHLQPQHPRQEVAASVLRQIAEALPGGGSPQEDAIELKLNPEELGHLRFRMVQGDHGLVLHINAERPETLDLLRRHVDQLARQLSDLGYGAASFSFGEGRSEQRGGFLAEPLPSDDSRETPEIINTPSLAMATDGLDIRI